MNRTNVSLHRLQYRFIATSAGALLLLGIVVMHGQAKVVTASSATRSAKDPAAGSLDEYLRRVHAESMANQPAAGAIWTDGSRFSRLSADVRALQPHDLVQVVVSEGLQSSTDGTVKGSRSSSASSAVSALFQKLSAASAAQNLINMNAQSALNAQGQSENNSSLSTVLGGEVIEVLPNGMLLIEAARQVEFSQQTQTVVLRGLVRPEDISQANRVLSTSISDLTLQVRGHGIVTDYTHRPNVLVRLLQHALIF
ncbi:flagellar basal body L-ring protein FlgH [Terriglobus sp. TAA 43]|uniref:flagellar basal body L-ring protein FlgH n=1 Tax=Terriglobus sp. TAA 43 TaxID=278961 RepID=UPI000B214C06|nr:flagellar basal body L-ring protein FlgH [Terriglobus sp. TAA 43]